MSQNHENADSAQHQNLQEGMQQLSLQENQQQHQESLKQTTKPTLELTQAQTHALVQTQDAVHQQVPQTLQQQKLSLHDLQQQHPPPPRGRMSAYGYFIQTQREQHERKHPEENIVFATFSKMCTERWLTMTEEEKLPFHEMAEQDKKRYDLEVQNYDAAQKQEGAQ